jgi:hypothetical protein
MEEQPKQLSQQEQQKQEMTHLHLDEMDKSLKRHYGASVQYLSRWYGVENLTPIEAVHLKKILRECLTFDQPKNKGTLSNFTPWLEAGDRLLYQLYNINQVDVPTWRAVTDKEGNRYVYERWEEAKAEKKIDELSESKQLRSTKYTVTDDFKEYLRRLRERAHFP